MLSKEQYDIIDNIMNDIDQNVAIFGNAGTGKTTMTKELIYKLYDEGLSVIALAPTGCAVKNLQMKLPTVFCQTIHKSLKPILNKRTNEFDITLDEYEEDVIIIDEISMVEGKLLTEVLTRSKHALIIVLGDPAQLPPTNVPNNSKLEKILNMRGFKSYHLTKIFRQKEGNKLLDLALQFRDTKTVRLETYLNDDDIIYTKNLAKSIEALDINEWQFLTSTNNLRNEVNELKRKNNTDQIVNERIMLTSNLSNEEFEMYNGDIFENVSFISRYPKTVFGEIVSYDQLRMPCEDLNFPSNAYELAYCITVHKSQGNEFENVCLILPQHWQHVDFVSKELLYTAITRAKSKIKIIIVGE